ncbi:MAG: NAD-dependent epimerase/dehydratase family protein, partial [Alphaproteobacteria bacterium]|nr:NAD-dependent epimerase/dehydratase family protein [Alphaproteobacteria bacterium]
MLCLVTGGAGFLGGHLVRLLRAAGHRVRVLDPAAADEADRGSVTDPVAVGHAMSGADVVFHMAAIAHLWSPDAQDFQRVNVEGTRVVLQAARRARPKRVVVTSTALILKGATSERVDETRPMPPLAEMIGAYARSKWLADQACAAAEDVPLVRLYPTVPIGPGDVSMTPPTRMIADFLAGGLPAYLDCVLDVVPVEVVALAHLRAAERAMPGDRYILAGEAIRMSRLLSLLSEISGRPPPRFAVPAPV